jgi:predicted acylesterase/phospholipase RssA
MVNNRMEEPSTQKKIQHIVINGGGPLLFNMYGALKQSNKKKIWNYEDIETYYGTSAGAILATLMALKYDWDELDNYIINRPWHHVLKFNILEIYDYYVNNGITDIQLINEFFSPLLKAKDISTDVTFAEFKQITGVGLCIYSTKYTTLSIKEFSTENTPNVKVLEAVYASSALPILLKPIQIENNIYIDGSICTNYPLSKCLEKNVDPQTVLGIKNKYPETETAQIEHMNMFDYMTSLIFSLFTKMENAEKITNNACNICTEGVTELLVSSTPGDFSKFFKIASCKEERQNAINKGVEDVNCLQPFSQSFPNCHQ